MTSLKKQFRSSMRKLISILVIFLFPLGIFAQELKCSVQVVAQRVSNVDKSVFDALQTSIYEFMNNKKWTKDVFGNDERIECSILINITQAHSVDDFEGTFQVQSRRPVFNASYSTSLLNHQDNDLRFRYVQYQPLEFSESVHMNNLTSILGFYAYFIIGLDYDTFSQEGGNTYFQKVSTIVSNAQKEKLSGWKAYEGTSNRYWMIENYLNSPQFKPMRECMYKYHREGFDKLSENIEEGRNAVTEALSLLRKVHRDKPGSFNLKMFFNAKANELVNLYSQATPQDKAKAVNLLNQIDPGNSGKWEKIRNSN